MGVAAELFSRLGARLAARLSRGDPVYLDSFAAVRDRELRHLQLQGRWTPGTPLSGLALSGGGIRSAAFACGVLQALARAGKLDRFQYLSTVSGGGYAGAALTWALQMRPGRNPNELDAFAVADGAEAIPLIDHVRGRANYLAPNTELTLLTGLANTIRVSLTTFFIYLAMLVTIAVGVIGAYYAFSNQVCHLAGITESSTESLAASVAQKLADVAKLSPPAGTRPDGGPVLAMATRIPGLSAVAGFGLDLMRDIGTAIRDFIPRPAGHGCFVDVSAILIAVALVALVFITLGYLLLYLFWPGFESTYRHRYAMATRFARWSLRLLGLIALFALPILHSFVLKIAEEPWLSTVGLIPPALGGLAYAASMIRRLGERQRALAMRVASGLLFFAFIWLVYALAFHIVIWALPAGIGVDRDLFAWRTIAGYVAVAALYLFICLRFNPNYISPHRFYRDRLMEAFMPSLRAGEYGDPDRAPLHRMCGAPQRPDEAPAPYAGPYHLINTNVILVRSRKPKLYQRGGDSFVLSPLFCGSAATGWMQTGRYSSGSRLSGGSPLSLATAMAISGAATNPNTSDGDELLTRRWTVSFLMTLLSIRLGYWQQNPNLPARRKLPLASRTPEPSFARPGLVSLFSSYYDETQRYVELSDGGHFDNTGLYELLRRQTAIIVLSDASADPDYSLDDLARAAALAHIDFGIDIAFEGLPPEQSAAVWDRMAAGPGQPGAYRGKGLPVAHEALRAKLLAEGFAVGRVSYPQPDGGRREGILLYLKPALVAGSAPDVASYALNHPDFPHQSTSNQFFTERQFEAYRRLGCEIASAALARVALFPPSAEAAPLLPVPALLSPDRG